MRSSRAAIVVAAVVVAVPVAPGCALVSLDDLTGGGVLVPDASSGTKLAADASDEDRQQPSPADGATSSGETSTDDAGFDVGAPQDAEVADTSVADSSATPPADAASERATTGEASTGEGAASEASTSEASTPESSTKPTGYAAAVLADSPVAYWRLDETAGPTAKDSSGHGNDASYAGGITFGVGGALAGDGDGAVSLDGSSGFVTAGNRFQYGAQQAFSLEAWVLPKQASVVAAVASRDDLSGGSPSQGYLFFVAPSNGDCALQRFGGNNAASAVSAASVSSSAFTHLVATYDGSTLLVYANGAQQGAAGASFSVSGAASAFVVGAEAGGTSNYFGGVMDEVAVYDHALASGRVNAHYLAGHTAGP